MNQYGLVILSAIHSLTTITSKKFWTYEVRPGTSYNKRDAEVQYFASDQKAADIEQAALSSDIHIF